MATIIDAMAEMKAAVDRNTEVDGSVKVLLQRLSAIILANINAPAELKALANSLANDNTSLAEAVVAHTPVDEPPPA